MAQPKFKTKPGQTDYTNIRYAPVINCVVRYNDKILLVRRSSDLRLYPGYWNGVSGFLDDHQGILEKVRTELREELGIPASKIKRVRIGQIFEMEAPKYKKTWIIHPILADIVTSDIRLDWEAQSHEWMTLAEAKKKKTLPGFKQVLKEIEKL